MATAADLLQPRFLGESRAVAGVKENFYTILYLLILGFFFAFPLVYCIRLRCRQRQRHAEERAQRAAHRRMKFKCKAEKQARLAQLFAPVRMIIEEENLVRKDSCTFDECVSTVAVSVETTSSESNSSLHGTDMNETPEYVQDIETGRVAKREDFAQSGSFDAAATLETTAVPDRNETDACPGGDSNSPSSANDIESGLVQPRENSGESGPTVGATKATNPAAEPQGDSTSTSPNNEYDIEAGGEKGEGEYDYKDLFADENLFVEIPAARMHAASESIRNDPGTRLIPSPCAICLCPYEVGDQIVWSTNPECDHAFHESCIDGWLMKQKRNLQCPCCRQDFVIDPFDLMESSQHDKDHSEQDEYIDQVDLPDGNI